MYPTYLYFYIVMPDYWLAYTKRPRSMVVPLHVKWQTLHMNTFLLDLVVVVVLFLSFSTIDGTDESIFNMLYLKFQKLLLIDGTDESIFNMIYLKFQKLVLT